MKKLNPQYKYLQIIVFFIILFQFFLFGLDLFGNNTTSTKLSGIHSSHLGMLSFAVLVFLKVFFKVVVFDWLKKVLFYFVFPISFFVCVALSVWGAVAPANTVYTLTRLNVEQIGYLSLFTGFVVLSLQTLSWWKKEWKKIVICTPFIAFLIFHLIGLWPNDVFFVMTHEDNFIENLQFFILIFGSIWCGYWSVYFFKKDKNRSLLFFFFCLAFFFVAGDEISWGQRILQITTPQLLQTYNRQGEITVHNLYLFEFLVQWAYLLLAFVGIFGRVITKSSWLPDKKFFGYFIFPFVFYTAQKCTTNGIWHSWVEIIELFFYTGIVLWICLRFFVKKI